MLFQYLKGKFVKEPQLMFHALGQRSYSMCIFTFVYCLCLSVHKYEGFPIKLKYK